MAAVSQARPAVLYSAQATFLGATTPTNFESFESNTATNTVSSGFTASTAAFTVKGTELSGVFNLADYFGTHATDGRNFFEAEWATAQSVQMTFTFATVVTAFGLTITDYGDFGSASLSFSTNAGANGVALSSGSADGNDRFFGIVDTAGFTTITLSGDDAFSVDAVYTTAVPSPAAAGLGFIGLTGLIGARCLRRRRV